MKDKPKKSSFNKKSESGKCKEISNIKEEQITNVNVMEKKDKKDYFSSLNDYKKTEKTNLITNTSKKLISNFDFPKKIIKTPKNFE